MTAMGEAARIRPEGSRLASPPLREGHDSRVAIVARGVPVAATTGLWYKKTRESPDRATPPVPERWSIMALQDGDRLLLIGDSITDAGRARPRGEGPDGLGWGYAALTAAMLTARAPERRIEVINMGISGNTSRDLRARWRTDCLDLRPNLVTVMIGVNDVWRKFDHPDDPSLHVPLDEYTANMDRLVGDALTVSRGIVVLSPFFLEPDRDDPMRRMMDDYVAAARWAAEAHRQPFLNLQDLFDRWLERRPSSAFSSDRVHPNVTGHYLLAVALLSYLDA